MNITIIGIGKLGLGFALLIESAGFNVLGVDINQKYVDEINNKTLQTREPYYEELLFKSKNFRATTNFMEGIKFSSTIILMVQTPNSGGDKFYDHSIVSNILSTINENKVKNKNIIIGCTIMPTYIDKIGDALLKDCENTTLSYNPEFIAQGDIVRGLQNPDMILIGTRSTEVEILLRNIYDKLVLNEPKYCILSPLEAEITKISINGYITTKISFANMISDSCDNMGADKQKVLSAIASDSRIGSKYFNPGYSFGGPCFPRDTRALALFMQQNSIDNDLLVSTTKYNEFHSNFLTQQLLKEDKKQYVIENVCYKENSKIPIIEESAKLNIAKKLVASGKKVIIKDDAQLINEVKKSFGNIFEYEINE